MSDKANRLLSLLPANTLRCAPSGVVLVALQHLLPSIVHLFSRVIEHGFRPRNIWVLGKAYSTIERTANSLRDELRINIFPPPAPDEFEPGRYAETAYKHASMFWEAVIAEIGCRRQIIVLDEGGLLRRTMPAKLLASGHQIVAIEHTSSGWNSAVPLEYPVILKARSLAKLRFESPFIAAALMQRLAEEVRRGAGEEPTENSSEQAKRVFGVLAEKWIGVVGFGYLGSSVCDYLYLQGVRNLLICDKSDAVFNTPQARRAKRCSRAELVTDSDIILGCTGTRIEGIDTALFSKSYLAEKPQPAPRRTKPPMTKIFGSCSSGDQEFNPLFRHMVQKSRKFRGNVFENASGHVGECGVTLLNGGFPLNFDRKHEFEPIQRISLTRELTFASIVQAHFMLTKGDLRPRAVKLDAGMQMEIVTTWVRKLAADAGLNLDCFSKDHWPQLAIPHPPPSDVAVWRKLSEGDEIEMGSLVSSDSGTISWES